MCVCVCVCVCVCARAVASTCAYVRVHVCLGTTHIAAWRLQAPHLVCRRILRRLNQQRRLRADLRQRAARGGGGVVLLLVLVVGSFVRWRQPQSCSGFCSRFWLGPGPRLEQPTINRGS